ncbi:MAG TPA: Si-specific NAD(P)(+) transhydrogenase [Solirubrobacteraceae bacterium]
MELDLLVIGSGPSGQKAAIQAAKLGKRVAVAERRERLGGVSIHTGTIPSKTLREAVLEQLAQRPLDVLDPTRVEETEQRTLEQLMDRTARVVAAETAVVREQFRRNRVGLLPGQASFDDANTVRIEDSDEPIRAGRIVIASGTRPARPPSVEFDDRTVIDSDGLLKLAHRVPRSMTVVGAGVIGVEYASMFGALGTKVTVVDKRDRVLPFLDGEIGEAFQYLLRRANVTFRMRESVAAVELDSDARGPKICLESGKELVSETVLYATGRQGDTEALQLDKAGLEADSRGRIPVDDKHRTAVPHIFAVGDVSGGGLAATAMEQGRIAALHAFDEPIETLPELVPTGVYAIPEIAMVGQTEEQLTDDAVPYVTGIARWRELARGLMTGDEDGLLKLLVSPGDRSLLGVHVIGTGATDLVHIGQAVMGGAATIDFLVTAVFNYPTFAESYKVAALDASNRIRAMA